MRCLTVLAVLVLGSSLPMPLMAQESDRAALLAFSQEPFRFESFCFGGDQFPRGRFANPERVEKLIGPFTVKVTYCDANGRIVTKPAKEAGRYAAVVEIQRAGRVSKRFFTLYHLSSNAKVGMRATGATLTLPKGTGIDPDMVQRQAEDVDDLLSKAALDAFLKEPAGAAFLAGLHDWAQQRQTGKAAADDRASYRERQWWVDFRRKYYGFDKLHAAPFVCPRPMTGKPAPVVRHGTMAEAGMKADAERTIDAACAAWAKENPAGFNMCVVRRGVILLNKGYGQQQGKAVTAETPGILASLTKFLCALLLLEMVDQGLIDLDDPVAKHIPALRGIQVKRAMTIRDLYMHTCGFNSHDGDTWPDLEEVVADLYPALEVGAKHQYQGMGLALASKIMEMKSGEALPYLYRNHLFGPLGCNKTKAELSSFGSWSIPLDLAKIGQMTLNGGAYGERRFFSAKTQALMLPIPGQDRIGPDKSIRWGIGIKQFDSDGLSEQAYGHGGGSGTFLVIDPKQELVIAQTRMTEGVGFNEFLKQKGRVIAAIVAAIDTSDKR